MVDRNDRGEWEAIHRELERLREENARCRQELAETNRGVTALYLELDRRAEDLEQQDRQKNHFLAMLGHELRNPLAAAKTALDYLKRRSPTAAPGVTRAQGVLERQLHNLRRLADDLLEVSRIARGRVHIEKEHTDLVASIRNAVQSQRGPIDDARHELHLSLPDEPLWGDFDPTRTEQILSNLLDNAIKYTPAPGRIEIRARRVCRGDSEWAHIEVEDDGAGIEPDRVSSVFETFVQEENTLDRAHGGLGLGLSLVKRLVELHGGEVEAHSEGHGRGSTFSLWLPLSQRDDERDDEADDTAPRAGAAGPSQPWR